MLAARRDTHVVGEAGDGAEAVRAITTLRPDLVFLDVQLPELDGFEVLEALAVDPLPAVIFVTAFDQYALRAFDVHALDYLLKPFDAERVDRAVSRAIDQLQRVGAGELSRRLGELLSQMGNRHGWLERLPVKREGRTRFVDVGDIDWIEADDHVLRVHAGREVHVIRDTLASLETRLDPSSFLRVH